MAFADYTDLKAQVARRIRRTDQTANIPTFIQLAETRINRALKLVAKEVDSALVGVIGSRFIALPSAYVSPITLWQEWSWGREEIRFIPAAEMQTTIGATNPQFWTIDGSNIAFERTLDQAYSFTLRNTQALALSDAFPTNWLLTNHPDVYYNGALFEAFEDAENENQRDRADSRFLAALAEVDLLKLRANTLTTLSVDPALRIHRGGFDIRRGD